MSQRSSCRPLVPAWATGPAPPRGLGDDGIHLAYRLRRPLGSGRGYAAAVARSAGAVHFQTLTTIRCEEVGAESRERPALVRDRAGRWRLYLSCATPGTRHWRVELMEAGHPEGAAPMLRRLIMLTAPTAGMSIATVLTLATPALATGPSQARITDPGLVHAIVVPGDGEPGQQGRLATLAGQTSLFTVLFGAGGSVPPPAPLRTPPPTASLGPRYTIIYTVPGVTPHPRPARRSTATGHTGSAADPPPSSQTSSGSAPSRLTNPWLAHRVSHRGRSARRHRAAAASPQASHRASQPARDQRVSPGRSRAPSSTLHGGCPRRVECPYRQHGQNRAIGAPGGATRSSAADAANRRSARTPKGGGTRRRSPTVTATVHLACCCQRSGHKSCVQLGFGLLVRQHPFGL